MSEPALLLNGLEESEIARIHKARFLEGRDSAGDRAFYSTSAGPG